MPNPPRSVPSLDTLLLRAGGGSQAAFAEVYDRTCTWVLGIVTSCVRDASEVDAVTGDVYLEVWRSSPRYSLSSGAAIAWIVDVAIRESLNRAPTPATFALETPA